MAGVSAGPLDVNNLWDLARIFTSNNEAAVSGAVVSGAAAAALLLVFTRRAPPLKQSVGVGD